MATDGARLAIRLLQDAAERGDLDPWDVDVIAVVDGFLDQLRQRIEVPRLVAAMGRGGSYEQDLAETSEAFLAASMLVSLKAEVVLDLLSQVGDVHHDFGEAVLPQQLQQKLHHGFLQDGDHRLGDRVGDRPHTGPLTGRQDHRLHRRCLSSVGVPP